MNKDFASDRVSSYLPPKMLILFFISVIVAACGPSPCMGVNPESMDRQGLSIKQIYEGFKTPPPHARPFVRWWWNNDQVEKDELLRELDVLRNAGLGGVEINPIACNPSSGQSKAKVLTWRSREWDQMLHVACQGAKQRGMIVDMIAGSGWPFGGEFLEPDEQIMRVKMVNEHVTGPTTFRFAVSDVLKRANGNRNRNTKTSDPTLSFVAVYPKNLTSIDQVKDMTHAINENGILKIEIHTGEHVVAYGIFEQGYRTVVAGVKGASGPTMDHMNKKVTRSYLNRLKGVEDTWGEPLSKYVRAIFCDSIETAEANWTHGILESFKKRKGYDIAPYLPIVIRPESTSVNPSPKMADLLRRARYDWNEHNVAVFLDNFTSEYTRFCHDHHLLSRYQAYGIPYLMGMAEGYMIPDIPESNNWIYSQGRVKPLESDSFTWSQQHGYMIWNKYASAGGHLRGKKIISIEAMTNTSRVFMATLGTIKQADDMNFITGMTHSVLHGFNYVPGDVPFPGWIRFGSYFSEYNTWWPYLSLWADYNARLSYVFQETKPAADVALIGPTADLWSKTGLSRDEFHLEPDYLHRLWEPIAQLGLNCDYLHENIIQQADTSSGILRCGPMGYRVLIVADIESMQPKTASRIQRFSEHGGKVIFVDAPPSRSPGLIGAKAGDERVLETSTATLRAGAKILPRPAKNADLKTLRHWIDQALKGTGLDFTMRIESPRDGLYAMRYESPEQALLFFANSYRRKSSQTRVAFKLRGKGLWRWDPETGRRTPYNLPYDENGFEIDLRPLESLLLVTGKKQTPAAGVKRPDDRAEGFEIRTPWQVKFEPAQSEDTFSIKINTLADFSKRKENRFKTFSGRMTYRTTFDVDDKSYTWLDLGWDNDFVSEIEVNGQKIGVNWYGSQLFDISKTIQKGPNQLRIRYTTTLWNSMRKTQLQPTGLMGPVRLLK